MTPDLNAPTDERRRRSEFLSAPAPSTESGPAKAGLRMYRALTTLERLLRDGAISPRQHDGGEHFRNDHELGVAGAREDASGSGGSVGFYYAEHRLAAIERVRRALRELGPLWRYTVPICVGQIGAGDITISELARTMGRNRQEVAGLVKEGLTVLADAYDLPEEGR